MSGINIYNSQHFLNWVDRSQICFQELEQAVEFDSEERVRKALCQINNSIAFQSQLKVLLHKAIASQKINALKAILEDERTDPNTLIKDEKTALMIAVESNIPEAVNLLINCNANINQFDADGWTILDSAANLGFLEIVTLLVSHQNCEIAKHHPLPAACLCVCPETKEIINVLLQHEADPNAKISNPEEPKLKQTALHWLCEVEPNDAEEHQLLIESLELLLQDPKIDPNIAGCSSNPKIPLEQAIWFQKVEITKVLLKHPDINPNLLDNQGLCILHKIAQSEITISNDLLEIFLESEKVIVDTRSKKGETALYFATVDLNNKLAVQLYNKGACPHTAREIYESTHQDQIDNRVLELINSLSGRLTKSAIG